MKKSLAISAILLFAVLAGIGYGLTPPPPPPPPVPQTIGMYDTGIDHLVTNATDQSLCRQCHQTSGTNISGGYNNSIGGVPTRHHSLVAKGTINPLTNTAFQCQDCHPSTGTGNGILLDRSCVDCHNGTNFWADAAPLNAHVGNITRPHHVDTSSDTANIGNPAAARQCNFCHGSFVNNYNDSHYKPTYATDFMITPLASFKATNFSQPDGLGGNKTWGGCLSCHDPNTVATPMVIDSNHDTHHKEILGFGRFGGKTAFQNASTPGETCNWCHVTVNGSPLRINITNPFTGELLVKAMEARNSTIESTDAIEFASVNGDITFNGTGCEKCHGVPSLHNIQVNYQQNGQQGLGHINNNSDCSGCHDSWLPANEFVPGALIPYVDSISPSIMAAGTATTVTITGSNFVNGVYTSVVSVDGVKYTPTSITDAQIVVNIPALAAGIHTIQLVKGDGTDAVTSKLSTLTVVSNPTITSAKLVTTGKGKNAVTALTITGNGFGTIPNTPYYVSVNHAGKQIVSTNIVSWSNTQIKVKNSAAVVGDTVTVMTTDLGEAVAKITK